MNLSTILILLIMTLVVILAIRSIIKSKKTGNSCGCGCEGCSRSCGKES